jgi:hypothetical protein
MDIDALHSALLSLTVVPEQIRSARDCVSSANGQPSALGEFLSGMERDLRVAKATLARELGFPVCQCCWPPELMLFDGDGIACCPAEKPTIKFPDNQARAPKQRESQQALPARRKPPRDQRLAA